MGEERKTPSKIASLCFTAPPSAEPTAACFATPPARQRSNGGRLIAAPTNRSQRRIKNVGEGLAPPAAHAANPAAGRRVAEHGRKDRYPIADPTGWPWDRCGMPCGKDDITTAHNSHLVSNNSRHRGHLFSTRPWQLDSFSGDILWFFENSIKM